MTLIDFELVKLDFVYAFQNYLQFFIIYKIIKIYIQLFIFIYNLYTIVYKIYIQFFRFYTYIHIIYDVRSYAQTDNEGIFKTVQDRPR